MASITKSSLQAAIRAYRRGDRPFRFTEPRSWYIETADGQLLPLKYIYAIAVQKPPSSFNTSEAIKDGQQLGLILRHQPKDPNEEFEKKVKASLSNTDARRKRLLRAPKKPALKLVPTLIHVRNPDVVAEVLFLAKGKCGICGKPAPFKRSKDGTPFLEVHHRIPLKMGGDDLVNNAVAACPNCHREAHDKLSVAKDA
jgi:5-methylcytosine-specific restriction protein A